MNWIDILKKVAPTIASAAVGPLSGLAVSALGEALGIESATKDKIADAFTKGQLTPEALERIHTLELQFQNDEKERGFKYAELEYKDRDSAREMLKVTRSKVPAILTFIVTIGYFAVLIGMMLKQFQVADSQVMLMMLGQLGTAWGVCLSFWMGTTSGSKDKTEMLANSKPPT